MRSAGNLEVDELSISSFEVRGFGESLSRGVTSLSLFCLQDLDQNFQGFMLKF